MRLLNLTASSHPAGNRIDLQWVNPAPERYPDVHILRSNQAHPTLVEGALPTALLIDTVTITTVLTLDSQFITSLNRRFLSAQLRKQFSNKHIVFSPTVTVQVQATGKKWHITDVNQHYVIIKQDNQLNVYLDQPTQFTDHQQLQGEIVYYYTLIPAHLNNYQLDWHNRVTVTATSPYDLSGQMYELLPGIYRRYDSPTEQLRRFLTIPGSQLDWLYSLTTTLLDLINLDKVDNRLLPLLASWIGWQTNYRQQLGVDHQRNEIRRAPYWYQTIGTLPTSKATLQRLFGWENRFWDSRIKELFHNVALSNHPEQLNFWTLVRLTDTWLPLNRPLSLDFAYEGRATATAVPVENTQSEWWLFYHTKQNDNWAIWYKTLSTLILELDPFTTQLDQGLISIELQNQLAEQGWLLSDSAQVEIQVLGNVWWLHDSTAGETYFIQKETTQLTVYHWTPSQPLNYSRQLDQHPTTGYCQDQLWVWWESYDPLTQRWQIDYLTRSSTHDNWSKRQTFTTYQSNEPQRRQPWLTVTADQQSFWLFWLEQVNESTSWQLQYQLITPTESTVTPNPAAVPFPDSGPLTDLFALTLPDERVWVFWAYRQPDKHFIIVYRVFTAGIWGERQTIVSPTSGYDAREPAVQLLPNSNQLELFWSSNQSGSWSIWRGILDSTTEQLNDIETLTSNPYSQHCASPLTLPNGVTWLLYRANDSVIYHTENGTEAIDFRAAGSTTVELSNLTKLSLRGEFGDFQTYTYNLDQQEQPTVDDQYTRNTIAIHLTSDLQNSTLYQQDQIWLTNTLRQFLPIQTQVVFNLKPSQDHEEFVYTYDFPEQQPSRTIGEFYEESQIDAFSEDSYIGLIDDYENAASNWIWIQALHESHLPDLRTTVDFDLDPIIAAQFRTCYPNLTAGGLTCGNN